MQTRKLNVRRMSGNDQDQEARSISGFSNLPPPRRLCFYQCYFTCLSVCNVGTGCVKDGAPAEAHGGCPARPLSALVRLYVYALHGCLCEVAFTAVWDWCSTQDTRLPGHSSLWALPMYATAIFFMESLRARLLAQHHPLTVRLMTYTVFIYLWEFSWGVGLKLLGACPWDYSNYRYNLGGLITLEYAIPWAMAAFIAEQHVIRNTLRLRLHN